MFSLPLVGSCWSAQTGSAEQQAGHISTSRSIAESPWLHVIFSLSPLVLDLLKKMRAAAGWDTEYITIPFKTLYSIFLCLLIGL